MAPARLERAQSGACLRRNRQLDIAAMLRQAVCALTVMGAGRLSDSDQGLAKEFQSFVCNFPSTWRPLVKRRPLSIRPEKGTFNQNRQRERERERERVCRGSHYLQDWPASTEERQAVKGGASLAANRKAFDPEKDGVQSFCVGKVGLWGLGWVIKFHFSTGSGKRAVVLSGRCRPWL